MKREMKSTNLTTHGFKLGSCLLVRLRNKLKETKQHISETNCLHVHVGPSVTPVSCSTTEKQDKSIAFKDVVFQNGKFKNSTINVTVSKKE